MEHKPISRPGFEGLYEIYEDGTVYSYRKKRFLKPTVQQPYLYIQYFLTGHSQKRWIKAHQLVAYEWIGPCPPKHEVNHKDLNKSNNHFSNLEYITHALNMLHARAEKHWEPMRCGFSHSIETKLKMANAKKKRILVTNKQTGEQQTFDSISDLCSSLKFQRRKYNRIIKYVPWYQDFPYSFQEIYDEL